jgi:predicted nucleic acid-binding protein
VVSRFVVDASAALPWVFGNEVTPVSQSNLTTAIRSGVLVPPLFPFEVTNAIAMAMRRNRVTKADLIAIRETLMQVNFEIDHDIEVQSVVAGAEFAVRHKLSAHDAAYLDLALRRALPLATRDAALIAAAQSCGVTTLAA